MTRKEKLLTETLGEIPGEAFALAAAARIRRRRALGRAALAASSACVLAAALLLSHAPAPPPARAPLSGRVAPPPTLEIMSDQDLLTQLKDEPVLIVRDAQGIHAVIFPDAKANL